MSTLTRPTVPYMIRARRQIALHMVTRHADEYRAIPPAYRHLDPLDSFGAACQRAWRHGATLNDVAAAAGLPRVADVPAVLGLDDVPADVIEALEHRLDRAAS